jgi:ketosteroid isomerase-like protein
MSAEAVAIVRALQPAPDVDLTELFVRGGGEAEAEASVAALAPGFTEDFVCVLHALSDEERPGVRGLRESWLDWLEPWETYRAQIDEVLDGGDHVLVLGRDFGRRLGMDTEVELLASAVWTVRDGQIARAEFFTERADAYRAAGLDYEG